MIGIYKYTNKINGHCYIGKSVNLKNRWYAHKSSAYNELAKDYNSQFHQAIRKYGGFDNFSYEVLETISPEVYTLELINSLEKKYIKQYDSFKNGYNATEGGEDNPNRAQIGEKNGRSLMTESDILYIRECYNAHISFKEVYKEYCNKISKRGLQKIWWFETWKNIKPEYHTEENKYWHSHQAKANLSEVAKQNKRSLSKEEVLMMRKDFANGMLMNDIWKKYGPDKAKSTIYNAVNKITYKDI